MDEQVKKYLESLPSPQKEMCKKLRKIILDTVPDIEESFKNGVPWYECKYYLVAFKDHVNVGFSVEGLTKEQMGLFEGKGKIYASRQNIFNRRDRRKEDSKTAKGCEARSKFM